MQSLQKLVPVDVFHIRGNQIIKTEKVFRDPNHLFCSCPKVNTVPDIQSAEDFIENVFL